MTADEYAAHRTAGVAERQTKREAIAEILLFEPATDFTRTIRFVHDDTAYLEADIVPLGSWGPRTSTWRWAWANPTMPPDVRAEAGRVRELATATGVAGFASETDVSATPDDVLGLAAVACRHLGALGEYVVKDFLKRKTRRVR